MTPHGAFGGNPGIQALDNSAWKLALILMGQAGAGLVEQSYHDGRYPIGNKWTNQVFECHISRPAPELKTTSRRGAGAAYEAGSRALDTVLQTAVDPSSRILQTPFRPLALLPTMS